METFRSSYSSDPGEIDLAAAMAAIQAFLEEEAELPRPHVDPWTEAGRREALGLPRRPQPRDRGWRV